MRTTDEFAGRKSDQNINELQSNVETGLSSREVAKRLQQYGYNEISEKEEPPILTDLICLKLEE